MDVKALAKSKRAHSQHHSKKPHPNQKLKTPSVVSGIDPGSAKKQPGKQVRENSRRPQKGSSSLPSNWDRYGEENESGSEDKMGHTASKTSDIILPKSKGADFRHLIAEAQSQANSSTIFDVFPSLDDVFAGEINEGIGPTLAVRRENILSWVGDDNFVIEEDATASDEASFLSLNLHALAEKLEKVDLSKRLFIMSDLLPPELCAEDIAASSNQESSILQKELDKQAGKGLKEKLSLDDFSGKVIISDEDMRVAPSGSSSYRYSVPVSHVDIDLGNLVSSGQSSCLEFRAQTNAHSVANPSVEHSKFEATTAETELDMLLDSFSETKILDSHGFRPGTSLPVLGEVSVSPMKKTGEQHTISSKTVLVTANLDDALDSLLDETSTLMHEKDVLQSQETKVAPHMKQPSGSNSGTKSKLLDDFDSWLDTI